MELDTGRRFWMLVFSCLDISRHICLHFRDDFSLICVTFANPLVLLVRGVKLFSGRCMEKVKLDVLPSDLFEWNILVVTLCMEIV